VVAEPSAPSAPQASPPLRFAPPEAAEALAAIEDLLGAIRSADVERILGRYLHDDRLLVFLEGPKSAMEGFDEEYARGAWSGLLEASPFSVLRLGPDTRAGASGDLGYVSGTVSFELETPSGGRKAGENRATWVLERRHGEWVIVAEHVSFPVPAPYDVEGM
jgi:ketosteroid isomerase-like protein